MSADEPGLFDPVAVVPRAQSPSAPVDKRFRAFDPHQVLLLPPSLDDWLPEGHLARFVAELVDEVLDLGGTCQLVCVTDEAKIRYAGQKPGDTDRSESHGLPDGIGGAVGVGRSV